MFSSTTIASSTISPVANASPLSEIVLSVNPQKYINENVEMMDIGIDRATTKVLRRLRRKNVMMRMASAPPIIAVSFKSAIDFSMKVAWL